MVEKVPMTQSGYDQLNEELKNLKFKELFGGSVRQTKYQDKKWRTTL